MYPPGSEVIKAHRAAPQSICDHRAFAHDSKEQWLVLGGLGPGPDAFSTCVIWVSMPVPVLSRSCRMVDLER